MGGACDLCWAEQKFIHSFGTGTAKKSSLARGLKYVIKWILKIYHDFM